MFLSQEGQWTYSGTPSILMRLRLFPIEVLNFDFSVIALGAFVKGNDVIGSAIRMRIRSEFQIRIHFSNHRHLPYFGNKFYVTMRANLCFHTAEVTLLNRKVKWKIQLMLNYYFSIWTHFDKGPCYWFACRPIEFFTVLSNK